MTRHGFKLLFLLSTLHCNSAVAGDLDSIHQLTQQQFEILSEDLSSALTYRSVSPAESLGTTGFDISVESGFTETTNDLVWNTASGEAPTYIISPRIHILKGLPLNVDVGVLYSAVPDSNIRLLGGEVKYAFMSGGVSVPAVALRLGYSQLTGVDLLKLNSTSVDLSISKGFAFVTPYGGVGYVHTNSRPDGLARTAGLIDVTVRQARYFVGINLNFGVVNFGIEADKTGDTSTYTGKVGWRF